MVCRSSIGSTKDIKAFLRHALPLKASREPARQEPEAVPAGRPDQLSSGQSPAQRSPLAAG